MTHAPTQVFRCQYNQSGEACVRMRSVCRRQKSALKHRYLRDRFLTGFWRTRAGLSDGTFPDAQLGGNRGARQPLSTQNGNSGGVHNVADDQDVCLLPVYSADRHSRTPGSRRVQTRPWRRDRVWNISRRDGVLGSRLSRRLRNAMPCNEVIAGLKRLYRRGKLNCGIFPTESITP